MTFLVAFVFLRGLDLGLGLKLTCISKKDIMKLSFISILMVLAGFVFFGESVAFWAPGIDFPYF